MDVNNINIDCLEGKIVKEAFINADKDFIKLIMEDNEEFFIFADGDCCSYSWFNDICGVEFLIGAKITKAYFVLTGFVEDDDDIEDFEKDFYQIKVYAVKFETNKGYFDIVMRNGSNGYYHGDVWVYNRDSIPYHLKEKSVSEVKQLQDSM